MNIAPGRVRLAGMLALSLAALGCGDSATGDPSAPFVGSWTYSGGMGSITCSPLPAMNLPWMGTLTFSKAADGTLQVEKKLGDQSCLIKLTVEGTTAKATPNQSCTVTAMIMGMTITATLKVDTFNFTVAGATLTETGTGTATPMNFPLPLNCAFASNGQLQKTP